MTLSSVHRRDRAGVEPIFHTTVDGPVGRILLVGDASVLRGLYMQDAPHPVRVDPDWQESAERFAGAITELGDYFDGRRTSFDVPVDPVGTPFQQTVWRALQQIPYGTTISYGELARRIGQPTASRAVGLANGRNPISIIVPCHRVIGADGTLTGYGGGLDRKRLLLRLEADVLARLPHPADGTLW